MTKRTLFHIFKDGEKHEVPLEKWAWKAVYVPTEAQLARAKEETTSRNEKLMKEGKAELKKMEKDGSSDGQIADRRLKLDRETEVDIRPERDTFQQFGDDGVFHQLQEIDQSRLQEFIMYRHDRELKRYTIFIEEEQDVQIFQLWRNIVLRAGAIDEIRHRIYVFGYKDKTTGATLYNYILPDDRLVSSPTDIDVTHFI